MLKWLVVMSPVALLGYLIWLGHSGSAQVEQAQAALPVPECRPEMALSQAEGAFYRALRVVQPGLEYKRPSMARTIELRGNDPLRNVRRIGDCDYRVHSFVTAGNATLTFSARATMRNGEWQVGDLNF